MNTSQLLKLLYTNRELIQRNNIHALEHLQMLKNDYANATDEEVILHLELNSSLAEFHFHSNNNFVIENSSRVISKFQDTEHQNMLARHYWLVGHCQANKGEYETAKEQLQLALQAVTPDKPDFATIKADTLIALAMNEELAERDHQKAIEYLEQAITLLDDKAHIIYRASALMGLGNVYINIDKTEKALKYYRLAVDIYEDRFDLANMASGYSNLGTCYINLKDYVLAEYYLEKSLEMRLKFGTPQHISTSYYNLALVYKDTNRKKLAYETLMKSKEIILSTDNNHFLIDIEEMFAELLQEKEVQQLVGA